MFLAAFAFSLASTATAFAAPRVVVPEGCGTAEEFERELLRRLDRPVPLPPIALTIMPGPERHHLSLTVGQEARELEDVDCRALFRAAVVVSATIVLPTAEPPPPSPEPAPPAPESRATEAPKRERAFALGGAVGSGINVGLVPQPSLALELSGRMLFKQRFGFGLAGQYVMDASLQREDGHGVTVGGWGGRAFGVYQPDPHLLAELGAALFRLEGTGIGQGSFSQLSDHAWAAGPTAGVCVVPLPRKAVWLALGGELHWNLLQPTFQILNYDEIFSSSRVSGAIFLRIGPRPR